MRCKEIKIVLRKDGHFYHNDRRIKAYYPNEGYAVMIILEPSQIDRDFDEYVFVITQEQHEEIGRKLKQSDELTYQLRGKGWASGPRSYQKVQDFI